MRCGMRRFALAWILCALSGCQAEQASRPVDAALPRTAPSAVNQTPAKAVLLQSSLVLPGTFSERTTLADLETRFGKANVKIIEPATSDDLRSVVLFPDDPSLRAYLRFHDDKALKGLASISVRDAGSRWRGKHGVQVGMSLAQLRRLNGKPFYLSGFDELQRGWVRDQWSPYIDGDEGRLGKFDVDEEEHMYFGVDLGLRATAEAVPASAYPHDENSVSSDDPRYPRLGELFEVTAFDASTSLDDEWE